MPVVGGGADQGVDVLVVERFAEVLDAFGRRGRRRDVAAAIPLAIGVFFAVADVGDFGVRQFGKRGRELGAAVIGAHDREDDFFVRRGGGCAKVRCVARATVAAAVPARKFLRLSWVIICLRRMQYASADFFLPDR